MYRKSILFSKVIKYIEQNNYDDWFILSAKYRLLNKTEIIEPYDLTLNSMRVLERKDWTNMVLNQIEDMLQKVTQLIFMRGLNIENI
ncbi:DUF6884 domain-containing protein [Bacillus paranthracis]